MANYRRILFLKSKVVSTGHNQLKTTHRTESTTAEGKQIKDFYESIIASETVPKHNIDELKTKRRKGARKEKLQLKKKKTLTTNTFLKAAGEGDLAVVTSFIEHGGDINTRDAFGWTALMCACFSGQVRVVIALLNHGALWDGIKDKAGSDGKILAEKAGHTRIINLLENHGNCNETSQSANSNLKSAEPFDCSTCNARLEATSTREHNSSTVHQFNLQHKPHSSMYYLHGDNKGYQMMLKDGWDTDKGLGPDGTGMKFPVKTILKRDRQCLGLDSECKPRITHFKPFDASAVENPKKRCTRTLMKTQLSKKSKAEKSTYKSRQWEIDFRQSWNIETS